jgi:hypothetical protein
MKLKSHTPMFFRRNHLPPNRKPQNLPKVQAPKKTLAQIPKACMISISDIIRMAIERELTENRLLI